MASWSVHCISPAISIASPVVAGSCLYWLADNGNTHVVQLTNGNYREIAINSLGEKGIASPAIADGRLYIRTDKHLFCVAGNRQGTGTVVVAKLTESLAELKQQYDDHPAAEGDDVAVRIRVVEALGQLQDPAAIPLLKDASLKDPHWDVSEAAVKALAEYGARGRPGLHRALPGLASLFQNRRRADVRAGQISACGAHAAENPQRWGHPGARRQPAGPGRDRRGTSELAQQIISALLEGLADNEGVVRAAAVHGLGTLANNAGAQREEIVAHLREHAVENNPLVASAAKDVLQHVYHLPVP